MSDYISREAVKQIIAAQCGECVDACLEFDGILADCNQCLLHGAKKAIKSIPASDVRPVVHGKWEPVAVNDDRLPYPALIRCNECGHVDVWAFNFCPNCGADMREES